LKNIIYIGQHVCQTPEMSSIRSVVSATEISLLS